MDRYARNRELISVEEQGLLGEKTAAIVGLGGLGGHIAEQLARLGIGRLILIDGDKIEPSNLNRQLFATERTLGMSKVDAACARLLEVNATIRYTPHPLRLTAENGFALLQDAAVVLDAVDNIPTRLLLESLCEQLDLPLIHGSIGGWWGQVSVVFPGDKTLARLYPYPDAIGAEAHYGNPAFTPALVASIQVAEAVKVCLGRPQILRGKLLRVDLLEHEQFVISI
ncbi:MAG: HesA/MoeB/ThiF family protein [Oscillospiraceae bacterium]|nr:HesA/MoeB/ThiF family protein [Oscillospiraceae bacterium]